ILLVKFLDAFVGKDAHSKHIPTETYNAPDEFVKGLVDGYLSADGYFNDTSMVVSSPSEDLILGLGHLLTRYSIFSKVSRFQHHSTMPRYILNIHSKYLQKFASTFVLSHADKLQKLTFLKNIQPQQSVLYDEQSNVILDSIVSIEKVLSANDAKYTKVYDITVPDTLNFQLFNGLQVRDTSATGYIQRKLVKAMEDCKVSYDLTVRNANGNIVQFLYGEDGIDAIKIEHQPLPYITMDPEKLENEYLLSIKDDMSAVLKEDTYKEFISNIDWEERMFDHFKQITQDREFLIQKIFNGEQETGILYPVSFMRIINNTKALYNRYMMSKTLSDLNPIYILD
ncbi:hypothetical protein EBU71_23410, partial [bacterium]|nr:hypothetical protein [Candidatus Elulimicrobium humile]